MIGVKSSGGLSIVSKPKVRTGAGLKDVAAVRIRNMAGVKTIWSSLSASIPSNVYGSSASSRPTGVISDLVPVTALGGVAPYTYLWTRTDAGLESITISEAGPGKFVFASTIPPTETVTATYTVTVTDATGASVVSNVITVSLENAGGYAP